MGRDPNSSNIIIKIIKVFAIVIGCLMIINILSGARMNFWRSPFWYLRGVETFGENKYTSSYTSSYKVPYTPIESAREVGEIIEDMVHEVGDTLKDVTEELRLDERVEDAVNDASNWFNKMISGEYKVGVTSVNKLQETYELDHTKYKRFELDVHNTIVQFVQSKGESIKIEAYYNDERVRYTLEENEEMISIIRQDSGDTPSLQKEGRLVVHIPEYSPLDYIGVNTTNGMIGIEGIQVGEIDIYTTNAIIQIKNTNSDRIVLETTNGMVQLEGIRMNDIKGKTTNGMILFEEIYGQQLGLYTSNGFIKGNEVYVDYVDIESKNGGVILNNKDKSYEIERLKVQTTNGITSVDVSYKNADIQ